MSDDTGLVPVDDVLFGAVAAALGGVPRFTNGVWRDRPWRYVPWRAWVYRESATFAHAGSGLVEVQQQIGLEVCFPFSRFEDGPSDIEPLGAAMLAEMEFALFLDPEFGVNGETMIMAHDAHELPETASDGGPLARAVMLIRVTYTRGYGQPCTPEATAR